MTRLRDNFSREWPYELASAYMIEAGYAWEIDWQDDISFDHIRENDFLREAAWVILSSGMRESVVRRKFTALSEAFLNWESAQKNSAAQNRVSGCGTLLIQSHRKDQRDHYHRGPRL